MNTPDPNRGLGRQPVHYFFLRGELAPEADAFLSCFTEGRSRFLRRRGSYAWVTTTGAAKTRLVRLFFAEDIAVHLKTVSEAVDALINLSERLWPIARRLCAACATTRSGEEAPVPTTNQRWLRK